MATTPNTVRKVLTDYILARLGKGRESELPSYLGVVKFDKNRSIPVGHKNLPLVSVYLIDNAPTPVGSNRYRPVALKNQLLIEVRVIVLGNDDTADPYDAWAHAQITSADRCVLTVDDVETQFALGITADRTAFGPVEGTQGEVTEHKLRYIIDYTTNRTDLTRVK